MADTGPDQTVSLCDTVQLDGSGSEDPFLGEIVSYRWEAPAEISRQQADEVMASFVASVAGVFQIVLVVSDGSLDSEPDEVIVTVVDSDARSGPEGDGGGDGNDG